MNERIFGYARCSTEQQKLDRQIKTLKEKYSIPEEKIFSEKISGRVKPSDRPAFNYLKSIVLTKGDTLVIDSLSRLSRRYSDLVDIWNELKNMGVKIIVDDIPMLSSSNDDTVNELISSLVVSILSFVADQEYESRKRAQMQGIQLAKTQKHCGRPPINLYEDYPDFVKQFDLYSKGIITARQAMRNLNMSHSTFYRCVNKHKKTLK